MFNLKQAAKADPTKPYPKQLQELRDEFGQKEPDQGNTERQLDAESRKEKDATVPFNKQLEAARTGTLTGVTEKGLNDAPKLYNDRRDDRTHKVKVPAVNLVAEAYHQEKLKAYQAAEAKQTRDTAFWDTEVGSQLIGPGTKIVANDQKSQLQNLEERFKGLKPNLDRVKEYNELMAVALKKADAMQFHLFAHAHAEGRKLTESETKQIRDINSGKARLLYRYEQVMSVLKQAQLANPAMLTKPATDTPTETPTAEEETTEGTYTIRAGQDGYNIFKMAKDGQEDFVNTFSSVEEAHDYAAKSPDLDGYDYKPDPGLESSDSGETKPLL